MNCRSTLFEIPIILWFINLGIFCIICIYIWGNVITNIIILIISCPKKYILAQTVHGNGRQSHTQISQTSFYRYIFFYRYCYFFNAKRKNKFSQVPALSVNYYMSRTIHIHDKGHDFRQFVTSMATKRMYSTVYEC